jgi:hypothetical protein
MSRKGLGTLLCVAEQSVAEAEKDGDEHEAPTPGVLQRVRNRLMAKGLGKHSFLKSAEEYENRGVNAVRFVAKSEKSGGAEIGRAG